MIEAVKKDKREDMKSTTDPRGRMEPCPRWEITNPIGPPEMEAPNEESKEMI